MNNYVVTLSEFKIDVSINSGSEILIGDKKYAFEILNLNGNNYLLRLDNVIYEITSQRHDQEKFSLSVNGYPLEAIIRTQLQEKASELIKGKISHHKSEVKAPMPGKIVKIKSAEGSNVEQGDAVLILEAMKMENEVRSPFSGTLKKIFVKEGVTVEKGTVLFLIE